MGSYVVSAPGDAVWTTPVGPTMGESLSSALTYSHRSGKAGKGKVDVNFGMTIERRARVRVKLTVGIGNVTDSPVVLDHNRVNGEKDVEIGLAGFV